jgi:histidine triad (HIT) family protein
MDSIFTKIIKNEIPGYKIAENDDFIAFLDVFPLVEGHTLIVPKKQVDYLFDLDSETYSDLWLFAKQISKKIENVIPCERIGVAVIGLEVPHAHIHLVPINNVTDIDFSQPKLTLSAEEFEQTLERIKKA